MFPFPSSLAKLQADAVVKARLDGKALRVPWLAGDLSLKVIFPWTILSIYFRVS